MFINEVVASNQNGLLDEDGDTPDWLELHNAGDEPVSLADWGLSDDLDDAYRWRLPDRTMAPGEFLLIMASGKDRRSVVATWDSKIGWGDMWRYLPLVEAPDPDWAQLDFDDGFWNEGPSGFGRGGLDDATEINTLTFLVRRTFELTPEEVAETEVLALNVDYDDSFVAYLNGVEVARDGIGEAPFPVRWDQLANHAHDAVLINEQQPPRFDISAAIELLEPGENVLALEAHDQSEQSGDTTLIPFLSFGYRSPLPNIPSEYLVFSNVWLHTSFALSSSGETITLTQADGCEVDRVETGRLRPDVSYGRAPDGSPEWGYFLEPTPGERNDTESRAGFAASPTLSPAPGYHPAGTAVTLESAWPGAQVRYTVDGSEPNAVAPVFEAPIPVGPDPQVVTVRAQAFAADAWPSAAVTGTYIASGPPTLPTVSLVTEPANLWDDDTGIYVFGDTFQERYPYFGANFWEDWERPIHVEFWEPDGPRAFAVNAGVKINGGWSRAQNMRSLRLTMRRSYGADVLDYPVFGDGGLDSFEEILLRNGGQDWAGCNGARCATRAHLRDPVMHQLAAGLGIDVLAYRPAVTYINGEYWGIYNIRERQSRRYVKNHYGFEDIDLLERNASVVEGDGVHYQALWHLLRNEDITQPEVYARLQGMMDTENFATYQIVQIFYDNEDWPGNNIKYWRPRTPDGRWRWMLYDTDFGLMLRNANAAVDTLAFALRPDGPGWPNPPWSTEMLRRLVQNETFLHSFINRYADYLNTVLRPEVTRPILERTAALIAPEMPRHLERWGPAALDAEARLAAWEGMVNSIGNWLDARTAQARIHIANNFGLAGTWQLDLNVDPPGSGTFALAAVTVEAPFRGTYFLGVPVSITAVPAEGFALAGWSIDGLPLEPTVVLAPDGDTSLTARFE